MAHKWSKRAPRGAQEGAKTAQIALKSSPRQPQESPKTANAFQESPKGPPEIPVGTPPDGGGIKGKGLPFDSSTTLFDFSVADKLQEEGAGKVDGRRRLTEMTRRPQRRRLERTSPSHTPTGSADFRLT